MPDMNVATTATLLPLGAAVERHARPEVKATLRLGDTILVATQHGLCRWQPGMASLEPLPGLPEEEARAIGPAPGGFVASLGRRILLADGTGRPEGWVAPPEGEKVSAVSAASGTVLAGTKNGLFAYRDGAWTRLLGEDGFEVTRIWEQPGRILVGAKKQGEARLPALAESLDGGVTWQVMPQGDYGDVVQAADARRIVTRWRGARPRSATGGGYKKHPITAAELLPDGGVIVLDGDKAEIAGPGRRKAEVFHPMVAEAEQVHLLREGIFLSGTQGAFLFDPLSWRMTDLAVGVFEGRTHGKRKRLFALDDGAVLLACGFGTFRGTEGGTAWARVDAEWEVFDAERIARAPDGSLFLLCQRGVFRSRDNGACWDYVKPKLPGGTRHPGEFRSLAVGAGRIWYGTKQGLYAASLEDPERLAPLVELGTASIEALLHDAALGGLMIAAEGRGLLLLEDGGALRTLSPDAVHEGTLLRDGDRILVASEEGLLTLGADRLEVAAPELGTGGLSVVEGDGRILAWNRCKAWQKRLGGTDWMPVAGWPADVRSAVLLPGGRVVLTDRSRVAGLDLPDAG